MSSRSIKETRRELTEWGRFWRSKRYGKGISKSLMQSFIESQRGQVAHRVRMAKLTRKGEPRHLNLGGVDIPFDAGASETYSAKRETDIAVPIHLLALDDLINSFQIECRNALRDRYILEKDTFSHYWLDVAERLVMCG